MSDWYHGMLECAQPLRWFIVARRRRARSFVESKAYKPRALRANPFNPQRCAKHPRHGKPEHTPCTNRQNLLVGARGFGHRGPVEVHPRGIKTTEPRSRPRAVFRCARTLCKSMSIFV